MFKVSLFAIFGLVSLLASGAGFAQVADARSLGASASASAPAQSASGPTRYPKDAKDWPGSGVIHVFDYMNAYRQSFWRERERKQGSVVFAGDSLIARWRTLAEDLPGVPVANRGIDAEVTRGLLFRFKEDVLDLHPKAIVLLIGTNDLSAQQDIQQTRGNIVDMLDMTERASPNAPIVLCTLPPRDNPKSAVDPKRLLELNKLIASAAESRKQVVVLDLYTLFSDPDGSVHAAYFVDDRLHMSAAGQKHFRDVLIPVLKRFNLV